MIEIEAPSEFVCPLTLDVMNDPIMTKYGQSYERSALLEWLQSGHGVCPLSRRPLHLQDIVTNHGLRMKVEEWRKENGEETPVVVKSTNPLQIYGFITLPTKDDSTDRTLQEEGEDDEDDAQPAQTQRRVPKKTGRSSSHAGNCGQRVKEVG